MEKRRGNVRVRVRVRVRLGAMFGQLRIHDKQGQAGTT